MIIKDLNLKQPFFIFNGIKRNYNQNTRVTIFENLLSNEYFEILADYERSEVYFKDSEAKNLVRVLKKKDMICIIQDLKINNLEEIQIMQDAKELCDMLIEENMIEY